MPVQYTQAVTADALLAEIEALLDWKGQLLRAAMFPGSSSKTVESAPPTAFIEWCEREAARGGIEKKSIEKLLLLHQDLGTVGRAISDAAAGGTALGLENYDAVEHRIEAYVTELRRLEQDLMTVSTAVDPVTGLRTVSGMRTDLKKEQDRLDRKGTSFSIGNIEIDNIKDLLEQHDRRTQESIFGVIGQVIGQTIRSFDDAYYLGKGEYLVCLKHVEFMDACAVVDRLRAQIADHRIVLPQGGDTTVTVSIGIAEALPKEDIDTVLTNAKTALGRAKGGGGNRTQEFLEMSVLQQYARDNL